MIEYMLMNWKLMVIGLLSAALVGMTDLYLGKRDELAGQSASIEAIGKMATTALAEKTKQGEDDLELIRKNHEAKIPTVRADAVANYLAAHRMSRPTAGSSEVPGTGAGIKLDDAGQSQCIPDDALIENAAEDAERQAAWQDYCQSAHCPVRD